MKIKRPGPNAPKMSLVFAAALFLGLVAYTFLYAYNVPFGDHWDEIEFLEAADAGRWGWLFGIGGGHFHSTSYGLNYLLNQGFGFCPLLQCMVSVLLGGAATWLGMPLAIKAVGSPERAALAAGFCAFILLSLDQASNWLWGWQTAVFLTLLGYIGFARCLCAERFGWPALFGMTLFTLLAFYAFATALVLPIIGVIGLALRRFGADDGGRIKLSHFLVWIGLTITVYTHYFLAVQNSPGGDGGAISSLFATPALEVASHAVLYTITYIGAGVSGGTDSASWIVVLFALPIGLYALNRSRARGDTIQDLLPVLTLMMIAASGAFISSLGRLDFGYTQALVSRYVSFSNIFWLGAGLWILRVFPAPAEIWRNRNGWTLGVAGLVMVLGLARMENLVRGTTNGIEMSKAIGEASDKLVETYPNVEAQTFIALGRPEQHDRILRNTTYLYDRGWPPFDNPASEQTPAP